MNGHILKTAMLSLVKTAAEDESSRKAAAKNPDDNPARNLLVPAVGTVGNWKARSWGKDLEKKTIRGAWGHTVPGQEGKVNEFLQKLVPGYTANPNDSTLKSVSEAVDKHDAAGLVGKGLGGTAHTLRNFASNSLGGIRYLVPYTSIARPTLDVAAGAMRIPNAAQQLSHALKARSITKQMVDKGLTDRQALSEANKLVGSSALRGAGELGLPALGLDVANYAVGRKTRELQNELRKTLLKKH